MLAPIVPSPMKPTFIAFSSNQLSQRQALTRGALRATLSRMREREGAHRLAMGGMRGVRSVLLEHVLRHQRCGHRRRPAGIEGEVGDDLAFYAGLSLIHISEPTRQAE